MFRIVCYLQSIETYWINAPPQNAPGILGFVGGASPGTIFEVRDIDNILNAISASWVPTDCISNSGAGGCHLFTFSHSFNNNPLSPIIGITVVDALGNAAYTFINEGIDVYGDSLNPPATAAVVLQGKPPQIVEIIQIDRVNNLWEDPNENIWTQNSMGNWMQLTQTEYVRIIDDAVGSAGYERIHPNFAMYKMGQEMIAQQIWDGSAIQSELADSKPMILVPFDDSLNDRMLAEVAEAELQWDGSLIQKTLGGTVLTVYPYDVVVVEQSNDPRMLIALLDEEVKASKLFNQYYRIESSDNFAQLQMIADNTQYETFEEILREYYMDQQLKSMEESKAQQILYKLYGLD